MKEDLKVPIILYDSNRLFSPLKKYMACLLFSQQKKPLFLKPNTDPMEGADLCVRPKLSLKCIDKAVLLVFNNKFRRKKRKNWVFNVRKDEFSKDEKLQRVPEILDEVDVMHSPPWFGAFPDGGCWCSDLSLCGFDHSRGYPDNESATIESQDEDDHNHHLRENPHFRLSGIFQKSR